MYVLVFVDNINVSFGPTSIDWGKEVVGYGSSVDKLKKYLKDQDHNSGSIVKWTQNKEDKRWIGEIIYESEKEVNKYVEPDQYYLIFKVKELK